MTRQERPRDLSKEGRKRQNTPTPHLPTFSPLKGTTPEGPMGRNKKIQMELSVFLFSPLTRMGVLNTHHRSSHSFPRTKSKFIFNVTTMSLKDIRDVGQKG